MRKVIVLAMPGFPPLDYPKPELAEFISLRSRLAHAAGGASAPMERRYRELQERILRWPRGPNNDPFQAGAQELAVQLRRASGRKVILGFSDFCLPSLDEALDQAAAQGAEMIMVITPVLFKGEDSAEQIVPEAVDRARLKHPKEKFIFVWPFSSQQIAEFLNSEISRRL